MTRVELILWSGCPSSEDARALLHKALAELGMESQPVTERYIEDYEVAQQERFVGSPTIRVNGQEVIPAGETFGLTCRVYQKADGRFSPLPEYSQVVEGIRKLSA
jgi:glutaredoxin